MSEHHCGCILGTHTTSGHGEPCERCGQITDCAAQPTGEVVCAVCQCEAEKKERIAGE